MESGMSKPPFALPLWLCGVERGSGVFVNRLSQRRYINNDYDDFFLVADETC